MNRIFPAAFFLMILFFSCKKENNITLPTSNNKVKTYTQWDSFPNLVPVEETFNLSYDDNNRVIGLTCITTPGKRISFSYPSANHVTTELFISNVLYLHQDYFTNSTGLLDSVYRYVMFGPIENKVYDTTMAKYIYNAANQPVGYKNFRYTADKGIVQVNTINTVYNADGYLAQLEDEAKNKYVYEYSNNLNAVSPVISGLPGVSKPQKNYLLKKTMISYNGMPTATLEYTYTVDSNNRIISEKESRNPGGMEIKTYTYF